MTDALTVWCKKAQGSGAICSTRTMDVSFAGSMKRVAGAGLFLGLPIIVKMKGTHFSIATAILNLSKNTWRCA
jgi:hypothetical protein